MNDKAKFIEVNIEQQKRIDEIRSIFSKIYEDINNICVSSRETSLAITKLEEAQFWVIKGISREHSKKESD